MFKKALPIFILFLCISINAYAYENIEIFDITQNKVVKVIPLDTKIEKIALNYLENLNDVYAKLNPIPTNGYAIKIPLVPYKNFENQWINGTISEIIIMFPKNENPFLIVFENDTKLLCFSFKGNTNLLLKSLNFKSNSVT